MIDTLTVVRRKRRRTHLAVDAVNPFGVTTLCGVMVPMRDSNGVATDLAGGATNRLIAFLRREFNDNTCCKRCTLNTALIIALYRSRDTGRRTA